ncbi:SnoaL-like polyketide cyclase [Micromonospora tulbaghiae]|uniref:SnoaL-like polyketide cyclase n=1 Tax=Micromonospora tulbaghiae TaxID=479978 RepID=A0A386WFY0_9ACTN|nr:nuclear transport factor 2 family protein [Micromonospora tulbaghiae]AYF27001.1 SnoaL-like polyketide cyclase [Micromonospora tulbaghiae]
MTEQLRARPAREVLDEHLRLSNEGRFAEDIERNVSPDCVVLDRRGVFRGHDGVRKLAQWLSAELPGTHFTYTTVLIEDRIGFLEWTADAPGARVRDGADSYVIEDGWIVAQTIHYTVEPTAEA